MRASKAELWLIRPPVGSPSGQQDGCGSGEARQSGGNERQDCHRSDRGKHDYGEPQAGGVTEPGLEYREKCGVGWNAERGSG
jgi:hypothetical protein